MIIARPAKKPNKPRHDGWWHIVKFVRILLGYAIAVPALCIALFGPLFWLFTPDPTLWPEPRVAPPAARIVESVERERLPPTVEPERVALAAEEPAALPELKEAPAALPKKQVLVALPAAPIKKKRTLSARHPPLRQPRPAVQRSARTVVQWSSGPVTTARSDVPY